MNTNKVTNIAELTKASSNLCSIKEVEVQGIGFYLKPMTVSQKELYETNIQKRQKNGKIVQTVGLRFDFLSLCVCDQEGKLAFKPSDADAFNEINSKLVEELFKVAARENGYEDDAEKN